MYFICVYVYRSQNMQHWTAPVPMPSLRPPRMWLASRSRSQTVSSTQASFKSSALKPSYTIVWLNMGLTVLFSTRVFWRLFLLVSGSTKLCKQLKKQLLWCFFFLRKTLMPQLTITILLLLFLPFYIWVNSWASDQREVFAIFDPDMHFTRAWNVLCWVKKRNISIDHLTHLLTSCDNVPCSEKNTV